MPVYNKLADIYDYVMRNIRYDEWAEYIYSISDIYLQNKSSALELAGGNCNLADYFIRYNPNLIVTDISKRMLFNSKNKKIKKICCDMTLLPFKKKFDLIYSTFDSINYLTNKKKLLSLFKEIKKILSDNGIFTFDVSLEKNSYIHVKNHLKQGTYKGITFTQKSIYNKSSRIHKNIFEMKNKKGEVFTEVHKQKIYPFETYFELFDKAGLYTVECFDSFSFLKGTSDSERVQFVLRKIKNDASN